MVVLILAIIVTGLFVWFIYNKLVGLKNMVEEAFSTMDVYLKKRWDLIPNLVATVKAYSLYEQEALEKVVRARVTTDYSNLARNERLEIDRSIADSIPRLVALSERYPDLKANESFATLSEELIRVEDEIAKSRKYYNACVRMYNTKVQQFPNTLFAEAFGFSTINMFAAESNERKNVKVEIE